MISCISADVHSLMCHDSAWKNLSLTVLSLSDRGTHCAGL